MVAKAGSTGSVLASQQNHLKKSGSVLLVSKQLLFRSFIIAADVLNLHDSYFNHMI